MDRATELYLTQVDNLLSQRPQIRSALDSLISGYGATHVAMDADLSVEDHFAEDKQWSAAANVLSYAMDESGVRYALCHRIAASVDPRIEAKYATKNKQYMDEWKTMWKHVEAEYAPIVALFDAVCNSSLSVDGTRIMPGIILRRLSLFRELESNRLQTLQVSRSESIFNQQQATRLAWDTPFSGDYHVVLVRSIRTMKQDANGAAYGNILPIIQSSGTGKSRMLHEAAGILVTLPLNVAESDTSGFPVPDDAARKFLQKHCGNGTDWRDYQFFQLAFLVKLFDVGARFLSNMSLGKVFNDETALALEWRNYLEASDRKVRTEMYLQVTQEADQMAEDILKSPADIHPLNELRDRIWKGTFSVSSFINAIYQRQGLQPPSSLSDNDVKVLLYLDEAHALASTPAGSPQELGQRTLYDTFMSAFTDLSPGRPIFLVSLSTHSHTGQLARPHGEQPSSRSMDSRARHHAPYTELAFDCLLNGEPIFRPGTMNMSEVSHPSFLVRLGRPLFSTRYNAAVAMQLRSVQDEIFEYAFTKLTGYTPDAWEAHKTDRNSRDDIGYNLPNAAVFAPVVLRIQADFDVGQPLARKMELDMVIHNLRIVYSVPKHRHYMRTGTPSEPVLAEAAARYMHSLKIDPVKVLQLMLRDGMIEKGVRGELVARLLLIMGYDSAILARNLTQVASNLHFSTAVPVVDFLKALITPEWHPIILNCQPDSIRTSSDSVPMSLEEAFKNAHVRFTHFGRNGYDGRLNIHTALAAFVRGMAVQGGPTQRLVDLMIPIVMHDELLHAEVMSCILIQVKDRREPVEVGDIGAERLDFFPKDLAQKHPFIVIVMQLGLVPQATRSTFSEGPPPTTRAGKPLNLRSPSKVAAKQRTGSIRTTESSSHHACYRLNITGCSSTVYQVLHGVAAKHIYAGLLYSRDLIEEHPRQAEDNLTLVGRLKPGWGINRVSYDWIDQPELWGDSPDQRSIEIVDEEAGRVTVG